MFSDIQLHRHRCWCSYRNRVRPSWQPLHGRDGLSPPHPAGGKELVYLRGNEEHSRTVLTCCHTGTATDTACRIHSLVGINLGDREGVGILCTATIEANIAACLLDLVERVTVYHKVFYHRECSRTPRLYSDCLAIGETAHVKLAGSGACSGAVRMTVDIKRAHTADTLAAVVIEHDRLFTFLDKALVENIESLEE